MSNRGPLTGVRVVELGNFVAAPTAGRLLADFGADVVKVERPGSGDELRRWRLHAGDTSLLFRTLGRNKRSVTLDLRSPEGQDVARKLIAKADVVLENFRPGTLERWGLGPDELKQLNPGLVLVRVSGYGQTGPYRDRPGFGGVAEAVGGLRALTGYPDRPPTRVGVSLADSVAGLYAVIGALMGLLRREREGGGGETVDVALYEAVYSLMESLVPDFDAFGVVREPAGSALPGIAPSNTYRCGDGKYIVVSGNGDAIFRRLAHAIGRPDLADDPALADNAGRVANSARLDQVIGDWAQGRSQEAAETTLRAADVPCGPILTAEDITKDPHFEARGMHQRRTVRIDDNDVEVTFPGVVPALGEHPGSVRTLGPELGEHTEDVLAELGFDDEARARLRAGGVI
ncbi:MULTISPECIES: CaiB/BaiF CoA-transferase family protein [unclassified Amycolatopsis]|uniref:CaiB/BaiF CoA transferase family protein n=1 Tax=unclassified Amycolatopsis TaxID=2618356 RepID=UPI001C6A4524|nr:CaiB/BaiF CoA-transferase family protein [Amycolatopsis sp. DSM 110486]QYN17911.1 CoA transferase [Amycolatopsis sp. DSM 110486]